MKLFTPEYISNLKIKNRVVMAPLSTNFPSSEGEITPELVSFYVERAKNGIGLIILESTNVDFPLGKCGYTQLRLDDDKYMPGMSELVEQIHEAGAKIALQLNHSGGMFGDRGRSTLSPIAPSSMIYGKNKRMAREMTLVEIRDIQQKFIDAVERAKMVGFDAVELHGAHGYLMAEFLSPWTNKRTDIYGGSLENRAKFAVEIIEGIRKKIGNDYPIIFRISGDEFVHGGRTLKNTIELVRILKAVGIDCVHVSAGTNRIPQLVAMRAQVESMVYEQGWKSYLAAVIRKECQIKTIAVGVVRDGAVAEKIINEDADFVALGRGLIADPDWVLKVQNNGNIRKCISCNCCIKHRSYYGAKLRCAINPLAGREYCLLPPKKNPAVHPKKVAVIGGGPAGMEAARVAAIRRHKVVLFEKEKKLGGNLIPASSIDLKDKINWLNTWLQDELIANGVEIHTGVKVDATMLTEADFDVLVFATGSKSWVEPIVEKYLNVSQNDNVIYVVDYLSQKANILPSTKKAVILGAGLIGCEAAYKLSKQGISVQLVTRRSKNELIPDMEPSNGNELLHYLRKQKVHIVDNSKCRSVKNREIVIFQNGEEKSLPYDMLLLAQGRKTDDSDSLVTQMMVKKVNIHVIGDCLKPRNIFTAMHEGFIVGYKV